MNNYKKWISFILMAGFALFICTGINECSNTQEDKLYNAEQKHTVDNQATLFTNQPPVTLKWSLERDNINKRTLLWNNPNKISYIYLLSYGRVIGYYVIKGKVSSVNSQVTNTQQIIPVQNHGVVTIPSPAEDGSYGTNGDGIFFFLTDGTYTEWKGEYLLQDKPLPITVQRWG